MTVALFDQQGAMPVRLCAILLVGIALLAGCDGPHQKAGAAQDKAVAAAQGRPYGGDGPNERVGRAQDRSDTADRDARKGAADALRTEANAIRRKADVPAARLDEQSRALRQVADQRGDALDRQADNQE
jgi:hypothetical protein